MVASSWGGGFCAGTLCDWVVFAPGHKLQQMYVMSIDLVTTDTPPNYTTDY